jgi:hypothetical protein
MGAMDSLRAWRVIGGGAPPAYAVCRSAADDRGPARAMMCIHGGAEFGKTDLPLVALRL